MNVPVIPTVVLTGVVVLAGSLAGNTHLGGRFYAGMALYAILLAYLDNYSPEFAGAFALLTLITAVWKFAPAINKSIKGLK
jgi:hypothetical protein